MKNLVRLLLLLASVPAMAQPAGSIVGMEPGGYTRLPINVSFVPGIGIGDMIGGKILSVFSINVIGGRFERLDGAEFGGAMNWETERVSGAQFAGVINLVQGPATGFQAAGVINHIAEEMNGLQAAGVANVTGGDVSAGQLAGVVNLCRSTSGLQAAGVANVAQSVHGAQIAGVVNIAGSVHGLQLGLINIADTNDGVPIGLFSLVRNTPVRAEIWADETGFVSAAVRSGNAAWYSLFGAVADVKRSGGRWGYVAALGHHADLSEGFSLDIDLMSASLFDNGRWDGMSELSKLRLVGGWEPVRGVRILAGPTLNAQTSWNGAGEDIAPKTLYEHRTDDLFVKVWPGVVIGARFF